MQQLYEFYSCITSEIWPQPNVVSLHESVHGVFDHWHIAGVSDTAKISRGILKILVHAEKTHEKHHEMYPYLCAHTTATINGHSKKIWGVFPILSIATVLMGFRMWWRHSAHPTYWSQCCEGNELRMRTRQLQIKEQLPVMLDELFPLRGKLKERLNNPSRENTTSGDLYAAFRVLCESWSDLTG